MVRIKKNKLKNGDILHCERNSLISRLIKRVTRSKISHTALILEIDNELFVVDSQSDGTRIRFFDAWHNQYKYNLIATRPPQKYKPKELIGKIRPYLNKKYGYIDLIRHFILANSGIWIGSKREDKNLICSEFVMRVYGVQDAYKMTPKDVYIWSMENNHKVIEI